MSASGLGSGTGMVDSYGGWPLGVECAWPAGFGDFSAADEEPLQAAPKAAKSQSSPHGARDNVVALPLRIFPLTAKGACS